MAKKQNQPEPTPEPKGAAAFATMAASPQMEAVGLDWSSVYKFAEGAIELIQEHGDTFLHLLDAGFRAFKAITGRDMMGIFSALSEATVDLQKLIQAIRDEFGIEG